MPELPEVETIRRHVAPVAEGAVVASIDVLDPRWCAPLAPAVLSDAVAGRRVERLGRRGKYLVWELEDEVHLLMHLRMTGTLLVDPPAGARYTRVVLGLQDARGRAPSHELRFCDPRRFGTGELALGAPALAALLSARLGVEPLDGALTGPLLRALARGRRAPVKTFLLDQRHVAGIGNIYADEALFRARVHPLRSAGSLRPRQYDALAAGIRDALTAGLAAGGATIDDFRHPDGVSGAFQHEFLVHRRAGELCPRCGAPIGKLVVGGRGTYVCRRCQRPPRSVA